MEDSSHKTCKMPDHGQQKAKADCCKPDSPTFMGNKPESASFLSLGWWQDRVAWKKASKNTLNCLIGCSIGDFGMIIYIQYNYPETPIMLTMGLAMISGLITSILLESAILRIKEGLSWKNAFHMAFSMSFLSMLGMEFAENATDYFLTGGTVPLSDPWYWGALFISLIVGFLAPLPYNYYKFKKFGQACH